MRYHGILHIPGLHANFFGGGELMSVEKACKTPDDYTRILLAILQ